MTKNVSILIWLIMIMLASLWTAIPKSYSQPFYNQNSPWTEDTIENERIWTSTPILNDIIYDNNFTGDLQTTVGLNKGQLTAIKKFAENVLLEYRLLDTESKVVVTDENLTLEEKREKIKEIGYNQRVVRIVNSADESVKRILTPSQYLKFLAWAEQKYEEVKNIAEEYKHKPPPDISNKPTRVLPPAK